MPAAGERRLVSLSLLSGFTIEFRQENAVVVARSACGELAVASYPDNQGGSGDFFRRAGGAGGGWRLI